MQIDRVPQLSAWLAETDIVLLELRGPDLLLRLRHDGVDAIVVQELTTPAAETAHPPSHSLTVNAPSVGVFLHAHPLHPAALAPVGARVRAGEAVGLLQIGALLLPVPAPQAATVIGMRVAHGATVGYGTPLVDLDPL
jgi:acetyl-CoA carboxylase biotin carboxyl carrier protein